MTHPERQSGSLPIAAIGLATLLLAACGQYGDLYLPEETVAEEKEQGQVEIEDEEQQEVTQPAPL
jgi:predicted small lipoprotein YifL